MSDSIIYSEAYQELYREYIKLGEEKNKIKAELQNVSKIILRKSNPSTMKWRNIKMKRKDFQV